MSIFSCVMGDVQDVMNQVTQQANQIEETMGSIRGGMAPIEGGGWTGAGAQAFIEEVQSRLIPEIMSLMASIMGFGGNITSALDMVTQGDNDCFNLVNQVSDIFDGIF